MLACMWLQTLPSVDQIWKKYAESVHEKTSDQILSEVLALCIVKTTLKHMGQQKTINTNLYVDGLDIVQAELLAFQRPLLAVNESLGL